MFCDGVELTEVSYRLRREVLTALSIDHPRLVVPTHMPDADPRALLEIAEEHALEGIVGKELDSVYRPGRSAAWIKRPLRKSIEIAIGGWIPSSGGLGSGLGSLLIGLPSATSASGTPTQVEFAGGVGTGWSHAMGRRILDQLLARERDASLFKDAVPREYARFAHWVVPELICDVEYRNWTSDGLLRHASFRGLRPDRNLLDLS